MSQGFSGGLTGPVFIGAGVTALLAGLAADFLQPMGPLAMFLAVLFTLIMLVTGIVSLLPPIGAAMRPAALFAGLMAVSFAGFTALQLFVAPKPAGWRQGGLAAMVKPVEAAQTWVLRQIGERKFETAEAEQAPPAPAVVLPPQLPPLSPAAQKLKDLGAALSAADPAERLRAAASSLAEKDQAVIAAAVDAMYRSNDPAMRHLAVKRLLSQRRGAKIPLIVSAPGADTPEAKAFANGLQGQILALKTVNELSGAVEGAFCGQALSGSINRANVALSGRCKLGEKDHAIVFVLTATDDYRLVGDARADSGETAKVELPLQ